MEHWKSGAVSTCGGGCKGTGKIEVVVYKSHYDYLNQVLPSFFKAIKVNHPEMAFGATTAHGDKGYGYQDKWEKAGLHFYQAMAIYLASYYHPFSDECRNTKAGWVDPGDWVITNKDRFLSFLPKVEG